MFFQEVLKKPLVPHSFASGNDRAVIVSNVSSKREHGTCLVFSPRLRPFVEPIARVDKEGLIAAALLHLPGAPPILVASVYSPYKASRLDMERLRNTIRQSLQPLLVKYPNHVLGGDFNTMVTPSLDGHNMCSGRPWDWLASKVTSSPPRLVDSFRSFHPTRRVYTRYPQPHHSSESRIDMIFYSPPASQHLTPQSADILTNDKSSNHHPTTFYASAPPLPFREQPILKRKILRRLKESEKERFTSSLQPLAQWCDTVTPLLSALPLATVQKLTDKVVHEVAAFFHSTTELKGSPSTKKTRQLNEALASLPPPSDPSFHAAMNAVNNEVACCVKQDEAARRTKVHRCLVRCSRVKKTIAEALRPSDPPTLAMKDPANPGKRTTNLRDISDIFSDTLLRLGGDPDFTPPEPLVHDLLQHTPSCPPEITSQPLPPIEWPQFRQYISKAKPNKAGGSDTTNAYMFWAAPEAIQRFIWTVCNIHLSAPIPPKWLRANIVLLYKKGDPELPSNYRPIALLNTIYKVLATHATTHLSHIAREHGLIHPSQFGGLRNRRTSDHIFQLLAKFQNTTQSYSLYIDFNKAFNSVPQPTMWRVLHHMGIPPPLVALLQTLYSHPEDSPLIEGHTYTSRLQTRGLRQGCPLSPLLFVLYLNVLLFALPAHAPPPASSTYSSHAFIDDLLFRSTCPKHIQSILGFFDTVGRQWGLDMNLGKTEVHAMGSAPQREFPTQTGRPLSTLNTDTGLPHTVYKYLGVYIYTAEQQSNTFALATSEIRSFFTLLQPLALTLSEHIRLVNIQLIPVLTYRLMAHPLTLKALRRLHGLIWAHLRRPNEESRLTPKLSPKDKYTPRKKGGLGSRHFMYVVLQDTVNSAIRYLNGDGPQDVCRMVREALLTPCRSALQDTVVDAAQGLGLRFNALGPWSPALPHQLQRGEPVWAKFRGVVGRECDMFQGVVEDTSATTASVSFCSHVGTERYTLRDSLDQEYVLHPPVTAVQPEFFRYPALAAPKLLNTPSFFCPSQNKPLPPPPYGGVHLRSSPDALVYELQVDPHALRPTDLKAWGCHAAARLLARASGATVWIYLDGSAGRGGYGSAATIYLPAGTTLVLCLPSPFQSSGGAEFWAAILMVRWVATALPHSTIHVLGDNTQVISMFDPSSPPPQHPSCTTDGTWSWALKSEISSLPSHISIQAAWIKGHAGFQGNEISDAFSKWIAYVCEWSPSLLPPPPLGTISDGLLPIAHKITPSHLRRLYPTHANYNIHTATSFDYYAHSSWFSIRPFKWTSGNLNVTTWPLHDDLRVYPCHLCGTPHVMEPLAHLALCPSADPILQSLIHTWPHPFDAITQQWWATPPPVGDKRNFVRTLVPTSLHQAFLVPTSGQTNAERRRQLQEALPVRRRALHSAIPKAVEWLREHSPQLPRPAPLSANTWGTVGCPFSTSHTPPPPHDYRYQAPAPLPLTVRTPPLRKRARPETASAPPRPRKARRITRQAGPAARAPKRPPSDPPPAKRPRPSGIQTTLFFAPPPPPNDPHGGQRVPRPKPAPYGPPPWQRTIDSAFRACDASASASSAQPPPQHP